MLIMSLFEKIWKMSPLGPATHPGVTIYQHLCMNSFIRCFFLREAGGNLCRQGMGVYEKGNFETLGQFPGLRIGCHQKV